MSFVIEESGDAPVRGRYVYVVDVSQGGTVIFVGLTASHLGL
jgi:hypothetical protein